MPRPAKVKSEHFNYFIDVMRQLQWDLQQEVIRHGQVPLSWHEIARDRGRKPQIKVTLRLEEDVLKFFRALGKGYQARMNDVLRAWMHGRIADIIDCPDARDREAALSVSGERVRLGDAALSKMGIVRNGDGTLTDLEEMAAIEEVGVEEGEWTTERMRRYYEGKLTEL